MRLDRLRLVNFRQHEETDLRFSAGLTGVVGPNGSGKTTLLEALAWAIYGTKAVRGTADSIRRRSAPARARVEVTAEFALGAHRYRVIRTLYGAELYQDDGPAPVADSTTAVTERLTRLLGMSREEFFNTYFTGQKELVILGAMTPLEREKFLSRVLGHERLATVQKRVRLARADVRARIEALASSLASPEDLAREEADTATRVELADSRARAARAGLDDAEAALARERPAWEALERLQEEVRSLESDLRVAEQQVLDARTAFDRLDRDLAEALAARARMDELAPLLEAYPGLVAERARLDALAAQLSRRRELRGQDRELRERLALIERRLAALPDENALPAARAALAAAQAAQRQAEAQARERHTAWVRDLQDAQTKRKQLLEQHADLRKQAERLRTAGPEGVCPTCGRPLGAELREVLAELGRQLEEIQFNGNFYRSRIEQLKREPREVREARRTEAAARREVDRLNEDLVRLEAMEQNRRTLATDREGLRQRLASLTDELARAEEFYDEARHAAVVAELTRLEPVRLEAERVGVQAARAATLGTQAAESEAELSRREGRVKELSRRLADSGWSPEAFTAARARMASVQQARHQAEVELVRAEAEVAAGRAAMAAIRARRDERERRVQEIRMLAARQALLEELDGAVGDLQGELTQTVRPDLSDLGSRFIRELTVGRYTEFELDDDFMPVIVEDGQPQPVLSGGEEDVINLALRLAISQMIAERAGQPLSLLVLDEIFGSLDEERRQAVVDLLRRLADRFPQVILITHVDTVRDGFDHILRLRYDVERGSARVVEEPLPGHDAAA
jgi:exonuclease SbcC